MSSTLNNERDYLHTSLKAQLRLNWTTCQSTCLRKVLTDPQRSSELPERFRFTRAMKHRWSSSVLYKLANIKNRTCMQARLSRRLLASASFVTTMLSEKSFEPLPEEGHEEGAAREEKKIKPSSSDPRVVKSICIRLWWNGEFLGESQSGGENSIEKY